MRDQGVTLVELIIVISIIGILAVALGFSYVGWQGKYKVEKTTKDIYSDLMTARSMAMTRNRNYFADFPTTTSFRIMADADDNSVADDAALATFPKMIEYAISNDAGGTITFDKRGVITWPTLWHCSNNLTTTCVSDTDCGGGTCITDVAICLSTTADSDYDCIEISQARLIMGKLTTQISNGGACDATNCVAK